MSTARAELEVAYGAGLEAYIVDGGEVALSAAYECGRKALVAGLGILDVVAVHHQAVEAHVLHGPASELPKRLRAAGEFCSEALSPFEMIFLGYGEANANLRSLNDTLVQQQQALEVSNRELESFSYSVSHDLRAPLRSIDGFSQALLEDYADKVDADGKKYLAYVREAAQHMGELIDGMLELARVARADLKRSEVDMSALARRLADRLRTSEPERKVDIVVADGLVAEGDPRLLELVLQNLIGNAWKFTAKKDGARIEIGRRIEKARDVYFVSDNGAGFDMSYAKKLFGAFQRLHSTKDFEGTGIGLATVQRIVRRHGGEPWAEGEVGKGATFYFTLDGGRPTS